MGRHLILSEAGDGVGLAVRLQKEGHDVSLWHRNGDCAQHGKGLIRFTEHYQMGQTLVADATGLGVILDKYRYEGIPTFAGSEFADNLEKDRQFSESIMQKAGIETPRSIRVKSWDEAKSKIQQLSKSSDGGKVVLKPEGDLSGNLPSYVAKDADDALKVLEFWQRKHMSGEIELVIQEFVEGQDVSTEGWFNGRDWIQGMFNHTLEKKHFLNDDVGPSGGCSGNLVWACGASDPIVQETLLKLTPVLREHRYCGPIDINCVVNQEGVYGLEFTPRFGYDSFPTLLHCLADFDFGSFMESCAKGEMPDVSLNSFFGCGIRISLPPWPSEKYEAAQGIPIRGMEDKDERWFYPYDVLMNGAGEMESSGGVGIIGVINNHGEVITEGFARALEICSRLKIPDLQYRTDLGEVFLGGYRKLKEHITGEEEGWHGVDLDGTIAWHRTGQQGIGKPIPEMVSRIRRWVNKGEEVRIVTARAALGPGEMVKVYDWLRENLGYTLDVTAKKDYQLIDLWDDRARELEKNTGELVA